MYVFMCIRNYVHTDTRLGSKYLVDSCFRAWGLACEKAATPQLAAKQLIERKVQTLQGLHPGGLQLLGALLLFGFGFRG